MDTLLFAINSVLPIILLIALGYFLKKIKFVDDNFLKIANKYVYRIALPALLFYNIYKIESFDNILWNQIIFAVIGILLLFIIGMISVKLFVPEKKQKGVIVQAIFRANFAIIGIPLAKAIGGDIAVVYLSMIAAIAIPLMNILSVIALTMYIEERQPGQFKKTLVKIIKNPLIIGIALGLFVLLIRSFIPKDNEGFYIFSLQKDLRFFYLPIKWLGETTSPIALIVLGGGFHFYIIKPLLRQIFIGTLLRAVISPLLILSLAVILDKYVDYFNFNYLVYPAYISLFASPTAITGAVMAKEMNNDYDLANQCVVWTTLISIVTIFITVLVFKLMNFI
ncbi:MAG: AEC family transporter [Bacillota bacterium]